MLYQTQRTQSFQHGKISDNILDQGARISLYPGWLVFIDNAEFIGNNDRIKALLFFPIEIVDIKIPHQGYWLVFGNAKINAC